MNRNLLDIQTMLHNNGLLICFSGRLSQGLIEEYGEAVKQYLETDDRPMNHIFNVFSVFIEQTQNINNYTASKTNSEHYKKIVQSSIVTIGKKDNSYYIYSGNLVENADINKLEETIDQLLVLDKDSLKRLYKEKIKQEPRPGSVGAGVGLIEIARKASMKLEYSFTPVEEKLSFFTLKAVI